MEEEEERDNDDCDESSGREMDMNMEEVGIGAAIFCQRRRAGEEWSLAVQSAVEQM